MTTNTAGGSGATAHAMAPAMAPGSIRVRGLSRSFGATLALAPIDLDIEPGAITGLLGPNGSGKSTLMRCLIGLVRRDAGEVWVDGLALEGDGCSIRERCTFAPGEFSLYGHMRAEAQLDWLVAGRGTEARERARQLAGELELPLRQRLRSYSHGMKRQLLFCAALGPRVPVRVLDEISEGLDPAKRGVVLELLRQEVRSGTTILLSSHHLGEVQRVCDRMIFMSGGKKLSDESADQVRARARRLIRLRFEAGTDLARVEALAAERGASARGRGEGELLLHLEAEDPRPALAALFGDASLPRPLRVEYGEPSLEDLYRDLYGEEAC